MSSNSVVEDMLIHDLDLVLNIVNSKPDKIEVKGRTEKSQLLDEVSAKVFFENGALANFYASRLGNNKERLLAVNCEEFNYEADLLNKRLFRKSFAPPGEGEAFVSEEIPVVSGDQLTLEIQDFIKSVRRQISPRVTAADAARAIELAEKIESLAAL
jgi:predicted dehydrogenase